MHQDVKTWKFAWKVSMTWEAKNHSDPPAGLSSWVFCRPEWVSIEIKNFSSKVFILYTVRKLIKNWANINKIVWPENGLIISYSHLKILKIRLLFRDIKLHKKSEFYEEIFSLSCTNLFFPLFVLISLHRKNSINILKIETNLSLVIISKTVFQTLRGLSLCNSWSELLGATRKDKQLEQVELMHFLTYSDYT